MKVRAMCSVDMSMPYSPDSCKSRHISALSTQSASLNNCGGSSPPSLAACNQATLMSQIKRFFPSQSPSVASVVLKLLNPGIFR